MGTTCDFRNEDGESLTDVTRLDTMLTVVDAAGLVGDYQSQEFLTDRGLGVGETDALNASLVKNPQKKDLARRR